MEAPGDLVLLDRNVPKGGWLGEAKESEEREKLTVHTMPTGTGTKAVPASGSDNICAEHS